jgi:hypothetical protein
MFNNIFLLHQVSQSFSGGLNFFLFCMAASIDHPALKSADSASPLFGKPDQAVRFPLRSPGSAAPRTTLKP